MIINSTEFNHKIIFVDVDVILLSSSVSFILIVVKQYSSKAKSTPSTQPDIFSVQSTACPCRIPMIFVILVQWKW